MPSGSRDYDIRIGDCSATNTTSGGNSCIQILKGHTNTVRSLLAVSKETFLTGSGDEAIHIG